MQGSGGAGRIAVIGTGISGMAAAWLLSQNHDVTVYERADRIGGHTNTVSAAVGPDTVPVDTGFIVYNETTYPNLTALFAHLGVPTRLSDMSLAVSLDDGAIEYSSNLSGLPASMGNLARRRFWSMLRDLPRFYVEARRDLASLDERITLGEYLRAGGYGAAFRDEHLLPMAAAIWSAPPGAILDYPAASFIRFNDNHGLLSFLNRPVWRTVEGGSRAYVECLTAAYASRVRLNAGVIAIRRQRGVVDVHDVTGQVQRFDHVVVATDADHALALLQVASPQERALLGSFSYSHNVAVLHSDPTLMPKRRGVWASWNVIGRSGGGSGMTVSYWMNRLQRLGTRKSLFVTLNPARPPHAGTLLHSETYEHPLFGSAAIAAQRGLWSLQGGCNTWFCGAYFGAGFHEDGLQAGLAVAEALGGVRRPWTVPNESGRIVIDPTLVPMPVELAA